MNKIGSCKYNVHIECERQVCNKCGWNPDVEEKRKQKVKVICSGRSEKWIVGEKKDYKKDVTTFA